LRLELERRAHEPGRVPSAVTSRETFGNFAGLS